MSTIFAPVQSKFESLAVRASLSSGLFFGEAPLKTAAGTAVTLPLVEFFHETTPADVTLEYDSILNFQLRFDVYAGSLADCETITYGVLWNAQPPTSHAGFAFGTITLSSPWEFLAFDMLAWPVFTKTAARDGNAATIYKSSWSQLLRTHRAA